MTEIKPKVMSEIGLEAALLELSSHPGLTGAILMNRVVAHILTLQIVVDAAVNVITTMLPQEKKHNTIHDPLESKHSHGCLLCILGRKVETYQKDLADAEG